MSVRRILSVLLIALVAAAGCSKRDKPVAEEEPVYEPVRIVSAAVALLENPQAARALLIGAEAKRLAPCLAHAGVLCDERPSGQYGLVVVAANGMSRESCARAAKFLGPEGAFVWLLDVRQLTAAEFREHLDAFNLADVRLWMPGSARWMLVGRTTPRTLRLEAMLDLFAREEAYADLAKAHCLSLPELFAAYVGTREEILPALAEDDLSARVRPEFFLTRKIPALAWLDASRVEPDIRKEVLSEIRSMQVIRRLVVEGDMASQLAKDKKSEEAAIEKWTRAAKRNPNDLFLLERLERLSRNARGFLEVGKVLQAMKCYETMVLVRPNDPTAVHNFGMCLKRIGKLDLAEQVLARAEELKKGRDGKR